ncbi:DUF2577 family protein [Clostridium sp. D33t1_170424_F3]|uniref:DUF2577 family protein n=1 Tax=Clostridium sp. D33t1_170424_F3 TaxID=2787099 RepID=UPI0018A9869D|nr:DUF2577 family protein [Clostridium sp. D33t1_170424_F3]
MNIEQTQEATSLKQLFQQMVPEAVEVLRGTVISASPLKIQVENDDKLVLTQNIICLPRHLSTYTTTIDIQLGKGTINSVTRSGQGTHPHGNSGEHGGHTAGDGAHDHPDTEGAHVHNVATFNIYGAAMTVYNGLKAGEKVFILSFNHGKKYYILDREA